MSDPLEIAASVLAQVTKLLRKLTANQLAQLVDGSASIAFVPPGHRVSPPATRQAKSPAAGPDIAALAASLKTMTSADDVVRRLTGDRKVTVAAIGGLAEKLEITIPSSAKKRDEKIAVLAESLVGYQENAAAVMGSPYRS